MQSLSSYGGGQLPLLLALWESIGGGGAPWIHAGRAEGRAAWGFSQWGLGLEEVPVLLGGCCIYPNFAEMWFSALYCIL